MYRGNTQAIATAHTAHTNALTKLFEKANKHYVAYSKTLSELSKELENDSLLIDETIDYSNFTNPEEANAIFTIYEKPAVKAAEFLKEIEAEIQKIAQQLVNKTLDKKAATIKMKPFKDKLNKLNKPLKAYQELVAEELKEIKQRINDWNKLIEWFPENKYVDVEGLCKIVELEEIEENDYSLTPGRYVGYSIQIDEDFDYQSRMKEIQSELSSLNTEANDLMNQIQSVEL